MKRVFQVLLVTVAVLSLSLQALAVNADDYWYYDDTGARVFDEAGYQLSSAGEKIRAAGLDLNELDYLYTDADGAKRFDSAAFEEAYTAAVAAQALSQKILDESVGTKDDAVSVPADNSKYPVGSYVDEGGNVFSADGELLSPGTTPALDPDGDAALSSDMLDSTVPAVDSSGGSENLSALETGSVYVGADRVPLFIEKDGKTYTLSSCFSYWDYDGSHILQNDGVSTLGITPIDPDLSDSDSVSASIADILGSVFGGYRSRIISCIYEGETIIVDGRIMFDVLSFDVVDTGLSGIDYQWLAGVLLFGILLFCLMKLLGGVLK